jgi:hypothetical protein
MMVQNRPSKLPVFRRADQDQQFADLASAPATEAPHLHLYTSASEVIAQEQKQSKSWWVLEPGQMGDKVEVGTFSRLWANASGRRSLGSRCGLAWSVGFCKAELRNKSNANEAEKHGEKDCTIHNSLPKQRRGSDTPVPEIEELSGPINIGYCANVVDFIRQSWGNCQPLHIYFLRPGQSKVISLSPTKP